MTTTVDPTSEYFTQLVGEDKKFKTPEDLAKGKLEADHHIRRIEDDNKTLKDENKELMEKLTKLEGKGNLIKELKESLNAGNKPGTEGGNQPVTEEALLDAVRKIVQGEKQQETAAANRAKGDELVLQKTGNKPELVSDLKAEIAKQNGLTVEQLESLSETSPVAFAKLIDVVPTSNKGSISALPGVNTQSFETKQVPTHIDGTPTKAYFDAKKKEIGTTKFIADRVLQKEYMNAAMKLGPRFYQS